MGEVVGKLNIRKKKKKSNCLEDGEITGQGLGIQKKKVLLMSKSVIH